MNLNADYKESVFFLREKNILWIINKIKSVKNLSSVEFNYILYYVV